jgi:hypothetical protein
MIGPLGMDLDARGFIERFRASYVNLRNLWSIGGDKPPDTELLDPKTHPIKESELPEDMRSHLAEWKRGHPNQHIEFYKFIRLVDGRPIMVIEDDRGLPEPDQLFTMSRTLTLNTSDEVSLLTELWVGRIAKTAQRRG